MNPFKVLLAYEIHRVLDDLAIRRRSKNGWLNLIVFRLSCCCGLRVKEMVGLNCGDLTVEGPFPGIRIRKEITKGWGGDPAKPDRRKPRWIDLNWDSGTLADVKAWLQKRTGQDGAGPNDPFLCHQGRAARGRRFDRYHLQRKWRTAIRCLGPARVKQLPIHSGRHSAGSHAVLAGHTEVAVRDFYGHSSSGMTIQYVHVLQQGRLPDVFGRVKEQQT